MLLDIGCKWVILGHSERRNVFGETDQVMAYMYFTHSYTLYNGCDLLSTVLPLYYRSIVAPHCSCINVIYYFYTSILLLSRVYTLAIILALHCFLSGKTPEQDS